MEPRGVSTVLMENGRRHIQGPSRLPQASSQTTTSCRRLWGSRARTVYTAILGPSEQQSGWLGRIGRLLTISHFARLQPASTWGHSRGIKLTNNIAWLSHDLIWGKLVIGHSHGHHMDHARQLHRCSHPHRSQR